MWKAIINWVNSKAYRCEHKWKQIHKTDVFAREEDKMPYQTKIAYRCTKCCESKIIKV